MFFLSIKFYTILYYTIMSVISILSYSFFILILTSVSLLSTCIFDNPFQSIWLTQSLYLLPFLYPILSLSKTALSSRPLSSLLSSHLFPFFPPFFLLLISHLLSSHISYDSPSVSTIWRRIPLHHNYWAVLDQCSFLRMWRSAMRSFTSQLPVQDRWY